MSGWRGFLSRFSRSRRGGPPPSPLAACFDALSAAGLPGAVVALRDPGEDAARFHAFGLADRDRGLPMSPDLHMRVGSVSKLIVAATLLRLHHAGRIDLDRPLGDYLGRPHPAGRLSLRAIAAHRSGLRDALENPAFRATVNRDPGAARPLDEILAAGAALPPRFAPGADVSYANINAILPALAAEHATGVPFAALAVQLVLDPARASGLRLTPDSALPEPFARGYRHGRGKGRIEYGRSLFDATHFNPSWSWVAGSYAGTIDALMAMAREIGEELRDAAPAEDGYGFLVHRRGGLVGHAGDVPGYSAWAGTHPASGRTIAVIANLSNLRDGGNPAALLAAEVATRMPAIG